MSRSSRCMTATVKPVCPGSALVPMIESGSVERVRRSAELVVRDVRDRRSVQRPRDDGAEVRWTKLPVPPTGGRPDRLGLGRAPAACRGRCGCGPPGRRRTGVTVAAHAEGLAGEGDRALDGADLLQVERRSSPWRAAGRRSARARRRRAARRRAAGPGEGDASCGQPRRSGPRSRCLAVRARPASQPGDDQARARPGRRGISHARPSPTPKAIELFSACSADRGVQRARPLVEQRQDHPERGQRHDEADRRRRHVRASRRRAR